MVELEPTIGRRCGVTFVKATVTNDRSTTQRIRLRNALEGPTWPPRRNGVPGARVVGGRLDRDRRSVHSAANESNPDRGVPPARSACAARLSASGPRPLSAANLTACSVAVRGREVQSRSRGRAGVTRRGRRKPMLERRERGRTSACRSPMV